MPTTSSSNRVEQALAIARHLATVPWRMSPTTCPPPSRWVAIGDPQAPLATFFAVLAHHDLLGAEGLLAPGVSILSVGDHFDYAAPDLAQSSREGYALLRWLAEHSPEQAIILFGNHDTMRVQQLVRFSDDRFARARTLALKVKHLTHARGEHSVEAEEARRHFHAEYPEIAKPDLVERDYDSFITAQRELVMQVLLAGRCQLAEVGKLANGREVLITHAGVTTRDLQILGLSVESSPASIASRLNRWLDDAVDQVRPDWEGGKLIPLELSPLHVAGASGKQGGGLLYHRPSNPDHPASPEGRKPDRAWEFHGESPRRFHPHDLPLGLIQACGHTGHPKCLEELGPWVSESAHTMVLGNLRTLRAGSRGVKYDAGIHLGSGEASLLMIDGQMNLVSQPQDYDVLDLAGWPYRLSTSS